VLCWRVVKCPHCNTGIAEQFQSANIFDSPAFNKQNGDAVPRVIWSSTHQRCPQCHEVIIYLHSMFLPSGFKSPPFLAHPSSRSRPVPPEVTDPYKQDFIEACKVLQDSPKASAALSRRNVQTILRDKAATKSKDLFDQIEEVIKSGAVPSYISEGLHGVRVIGNFAAHPLKSTNSGAIIEVEDNEAEWNLDTLERLFDFYFVQPSIAAKRKAEINKKLKEAGKPEIP
jgi:hypothetical protein